MGAASSVLDAHRNAVAERSSVSVDPQPSTEQIPAPDQRQAQTDAPAAQPSPTSDPIASSLQNTRSSYLRSLMRPVSDSDLLFMSQRACAQFMFRMPGVNDGDASVLRRMLSNAGVALASSESHRIFVIEGSGLHENLLACAAINPRKRDCHRWHRAIAAVITDFSASIDTLVSPIDAIFSSVFAAKSDSKFDKNNRNSLNHVGIREIGGSCSAGKKLLSRFSEIATAFEDAASASAFDLEMILRQFSLRTPDSSILEGKRINFVATNALRSRGYAISTAGQFILWHRPCHFFPPCKRSPFDCNHFSEHQIPRIVRPLPPVSDNPILFCNEVIRWDGLYQQLCKAAECAVEAILCQPASQNLADIVAPPLVSRIERGGLIFIVLPEMPSFGVSTKHVGQRFGFKDDYFVSLGFDAISSSYKPYTSSLDCSNIPHFCAMYSSKLYADINAIQSPIFSFKVSPSSATIVKSEAVSFQSQVDACIFSPGLIAYSIPSVHSNLMKSRKNKQFAVRTIFVHSMWSDMPLISLTWTSGNQTIDSISLSLPSVALLKFCVSCEDHENHPNFGSAVFASCNIDFSVNVQSRPSTACQFSRTSNLNSSHLKGSFLNEIQWLAISTSCTELSLQHSSQWAINAIKSLCLCAVDFSSCVSALSSSIDSSFDTIFDSTTDTPKSLSRSLYELFLHSNDIRVRHGCDHISFFPAILKQASSTSKTLLGVLYSEIICQVSANAICILCKEDESQIRSVLHMLFSLAVDETRCCVNYFPMSQDKSSVHLSLECQSFQNWWKNSISSAATCVKFLHDIKMLSLFQAEFGLSHSDDPCILESFLHNIWQSMSKYTDESPKKRIPQISRVFFFASWIRAIAARTLNLLNLTEPIDWIDDQFSKLQLPNQFSCASGWYAHIRYTRSVQKCTAFCILDASRLHHYKSKGDQILHAATHCKIICHLRFLLCSDFVSKLMQARAADDSCLPRANCDMHQDRNPIVTPREYESSDDFSPNPLSPSISLHQQSASALLDIGPLNFNARSQRIPLASTFGFSSWVVPVYISPLSSESEPSDIDACLEFMERVPFTASQLECQSAEFIEQTFGIRISEPQSTLDVLRSMHNLALKLLQVPFIMEMQFSLNALADVFIILGIIGSVNFDHKTGDLLPLNRRSSKLCQDMAAALYLRSMSCSRLNIGAGVSMFRLMCEILGNGQAALTVGNYMPCHFREFLLCADLKTSNFDERYLPCVALTDVLFSKILNTLVSWTVVLGFEVNDPAFIQACKRALLCNAEVVKFSSLNAGDGKQPFEWIVSALACPLTNTFNNWLSACNPEAPLNDVIVISSSKTFHLVRATAQGLAHAFASAISKSASSTTQLDVSCVLVGYASLCCKFFGEWAIIEKQSNLVKESGFACCPCQLLYGIVACSTSLIEDYSNHISRTEKSNGQVSPQHSRLCNLDSFSQFAMPCMCDFLTLFSHHSHGDKHTTYDPALLCFAMCPSRAFCDVSFLHLGQYCSDSTLLLVESGLGCRQFKCVSSEFQTLLPSKANLFSLNVSSCMFVGEKSLLKLISQCRSDTESGSLSCLCIDGCLSLTKSFMHELTLLNCTKGLEILVLPSFDQSSVLMGNFTQVMQAKHNHQFRTPLAFDEFSKYMKLKPEKRSVVDHLGNRTVEFFDPTLQYVSNIKPKLSDSLDSLLIKGYREDSYSAHDELMDRFSVATAWCREMRKEACKKEAILFERNRTKMFAENQWKQIDRLTGKVKSELDDFQNENKQPPTVEDGSVSLWSSNEKIMNVSVMMGRLEKIAHSTAVVRDMSYSSEVRQFVSKDEVLNSVMESFDAIKARQDQSQYVSLSGDLMTMLRRQKKDFYIRQLSTRARIRTALLHRHLRISARLCVAGQGPIKMAALMHVPSSQSEEYCQLMLSLVANSYEGPGCDGETIVQFLRCCPNLLHLSFVRAHPWSSSRLLDLMILRTSKTLLRMRQLWALWDDYKFRLGRMSFQRSIHYERVPVKEGIIKDHVGFHDRHCIIASKYIPKLVFIDLGGLRHVSDMGRSAFFLNCPRIQVVLGCSVNIVTVSNESLMALVSRMLPQFGTLFSYLKKPNIEQFDSEFAIENGQDHQLSSVFEENPETNHDSMIWSLKEHLENQIADRMSQEQREAAAKAKAELLRKEKILREVAFRKMVRRNVLYCKAAVVSHEGKTARLRWIQLNEMANFNPALRDTLGVSAGIVMAPVSGMTQFGEPQYDFGDSTPSMLASSLLRVRFQVVQLSPQCCQIHERIERNMLRVKQSNRNFDDPFLAASEIFGDPAAFLDPCQVFIRVSVEGQPNRKASRVKGLRLSHEKYYTSCNAGPLDIRSIGDLSAPIMMRQTGYLVIPEISSRLSLEIRCQGKSGKKMVTAIPVKRMQMPRTLDRPEEVQIYLKYAPKLEEDDTLNQGLQAAYFKNKDFIMNGGVKVGYVQVEMTVMSPWQVDLMVARNQAKSIMNLNSEIRHESQNDDKGQSSQVSKKKKKNWGDNFDPNNMSDCVMLAESSIEAFPFRMRLYEKYDRGNFVSESLLMRERIKEGDNAIVRCLAPMHLVSTLVDDFESWEVFKRRKQREREDSLPRWDKGGFVSKFSKFLGHNLQTQEQVKSDAPSDTNKVKESTIQAVPVSLEGVNDVVDARTYLAENRDQDSDFDDVDEPEELELLGHGAAPMEQQLLLSSIGRLVDHCVESVANQIINEMTFRRAPYQDLRHMRCLELDNSTVTDNFFLDCFDLFVGLRNLSIAGCRRLTSAALLSIAHSQSAPFLQYINISHVCDWKSETVAALCNTARSVIELRMDYNIKPTLTDGCVLLMSQNMKDLRLLSLNGVQSLANESVSGLMEQARNLNSISIAGLGLMNDVALQFAHKCIHLTFLDISFAVYVTDRGLTHIARCRQMSTLLMQNLISVTDDGLELLGRGCGRLTFLDAIGCERLSPRGPEAIVQLCPLLHTICLDATSAMHDWKRQVDSTRSTSNLRVMLNFAAPS